MQPCFLAFARTFVPVCSLCQVASSSILAALCNSLQGSQRQSRSVPQYHLAPSASLPLFRQSFRPPSTPVDSISHFSHTIALPPTMVAAMLSSKIAIAPAFARQSARPVARAAFKVRAVAEAEELTPGQECELGLPGTWRRGGRRVVVSSPFALISATLLLVGPGLFPQGVRLPTLCAPIQPGADSCCLGGCALQTSGPCLASLSPSPMFLTPPASPSSPSPR